MTNDLRQAPTKDREFWKKFVEELSFQERRDLSYVLDRPYLIEDIDLMAEHEQLADTKEGEFIRNYRDTHTEKEAEAFYDHIIDRYRDKEDASLSYWDNLSGAAEVIARHYMELEAKEKASKNKTTTKGNEGHDEL